MKPLIKPIYLIVIMSIPLFGCNTNFSEEITDYYNEVKGLWQYMHLTDSGNFGTSCIFFDSDCTYVSLHGCYDIEGTYSFEDNGTNQSLITTYENGTNYENIIFFSQTEMRTSRADFGDTLIYQKKTSDDYIDCGIMPTVQN